MQVEDKLKKLLGQREIFGFFYLVQALDKELDDYFKIVSKEALVDCSKDELYANIDMRALSTSYLDYYQVLNDLGSNKTLMDLGAGYCRGTFLASIINKECISIEIDKNRSFAAKIKYPNRVLNLDLKLNELPKADAYFIYLPWGDVTNNILRSIYEVNKSCTLYVIESHGDFIENLSLYKEFVVEEHFNTSSKRHDSKIYKYRFIPSETFGLIEIGDYINLKDIPYWLIKFQKEIKSLEIKTQTVDNKIVHWPVDLKNSYACKYNGKSSIYFNSKCRYLQYQYDSINKIIY